MTTAITEDIVAKILIVEDEPDMVLGLKDNFEFEGYEVITASDGVQGLERARDSKPDLLILDIMLPKLSGLEVCKTLRAEGFDKPIIMLTARGQEIDKVVGAGAGRGRLRHQAVLDPRAAGAGARHPAAYGGPRSASRDTASPTSSWTSRPTARGRGDPLDMSPREFELLRYLIERKGETVSREKLLEDVWGYESYPSTRTVDTHIAKLRAKIGDSGSEPRYILTIHGTGYKFVDPS